MNAPVKLTLPSSSDPPPNPGVCTAKNGPFALEARSENSAIQILLPTPETWLSDFASGQQTDDGDIVDTFHSFLVALDRSALLGCFAAGNPSIRDYLLQSMPMKPSDSLFSAYDYLPRRGGLDLKAGLRVKVERAYFRPPGPDEEPHALKNYLGVSTSSFDVVVADAGTVRFAQAGAIQYSPQSLEQDGQGGRDLRLRDLPGRPCYRLLFYTYLVPKEEDVSAVIIGASDTTQLDQLEREVRAHPGEECETGAWPRGQDCFELNGFVTVGAQIQVQLNGKFQFVDWGTKLGSVLPKKSLKSLRIERQFMGSYYAVRFDPLDSSVLSLALVGGDRLTWSKGSGRSR
ncbi:MAG: hypothetical protein ABSG16_09855 [Candidatus Acidiferrum sp.]